MSEALRLMAVLAHPDDESLGFGGTLAKYAAEGVATYLVTATRGERGWFGPPDENPGLTALGTIREAELRAAAQVLGVRELSFLDYVDGELDQADPAAVIDQLVGHLRRVRPQVVVTFGPEGAYGHPDHIAISQFTSAAIVAAADPSYASSTGTAALAPHRVTKFYYKLWTTAEGELYESLFGAIVMPVDGGERRSVAYPAWVITTQVDAEPYWRTVWQAASCHRTQLTNYDQLARLPEAQHRALWGPQGFYRVFSLVNGGRAVETDLFAGLRAPSAEAATPLTARSAGR